jgi:RimJ/RimL family protein N-acetyltransferase
MTRTTELRRGTPEDAVHIAAIAHALGDEPVGLAPGMTVEQARTWIERLGTQGAIVIASDGSIPVAFGAIDFDTNEPDTAVLGVWVLPDHRRRGLATEIADELLVCARESGFRRIRGRLPSGNEPALSFLSSIGAMVPLRNPDMRFELPLP